MKFTILVFDRKTVEIRIVKRSIEEEEGLA